MSPAFPIVELLPMPQNGLSAPLPAVETHVAGISVYGTPVGPAPRSNASLGNAVV
jgi:hypothetical protein